MEQETKYGAPDTAPLVTDATPQGDLQDLLIAHGIDRLEVRRETCGWAARVYARDLVFAGPGRTSAAAISRALVSAGVTS